MPARGASTVPLPLLVLAAALVAQILPAAWADVYMHSPRGSNDRNCERNVNRNNGNRLFDSQNNAKGGYACPRAIGGPDGLTEQRQEKTYYYVGEKVYLEWTNQHGSGDNGKLHTEVIWQYACSDTLDPTGKFNSGTNVATPRDGIPRDGNDAATDRIPDNADDAVPSTDEKRRFGMHESYDFYQECQRTERNKGLYTADQNVNRRDARGTRQNPNGNRNGLECPEERDYYPYWRPSPWRDIAVITSEFSSNKESFYQASANQKQQRGYCRAVDTADYTQKRNQRRWYNTKASCEAAGHTWRPTYFDQTFDGGQANTANPPAAQLTGSTAPDLMVIQGETSRVNQLGNSGSSLGVAFQRGNGAMTFNTGLYEWCQDGKKASAAGRNQCGSRGSTGLFQDPTMGRVWDDHTGSAMSANTAGWIVPNHVDGNCVLRLRYNISTWDFPAWANGNRYLDTLTFTGEPGVNSTYNCRGDTKNGVPCSTISPVTQDPYVKMSGGTTTNGGNQLLSLALNTNQYSRTFQDRTYVFEIKARPASMAATATVVSLGIRGKRGNIVQTYPAVEYDFAPDNIVAKVGEYMHVQWAGSDYNPQRGCNNGEGGPPDCQGCTNLQQQINAGNQNSRADRSNMVFMEVAGNNFPKGAAGAGVDLYSMALDATASGSPFTQSAEDASKTASALLWELAYIKQETQITARGQTCLTQDELDNINNKNRRENHPLNCAKLNGAQTPYFDAGAVMVGNAGRFTAQSTRNNNFSNRDQTLNICIGANDAGVATCHTDQLDSSTGLPNAHFRDPSVSTVVGVDGTPQLIPGVDPDALTDPTTAPIEKDNDGIGDGEKEACEARIHDFLSAIGLAGIISIAVSLLMVGVIGTLIVQGLIRRYRGKDWMNQKGTDV